MKVALVNLCAADDFGRHEHYAESMAVLKEAGIDFIDLASGVSTLAQRVDSFSRALETDADLVWIIRGGFNCVETLDQIDWGRVVATGKKYWGLSDFTHFSTMAVSKGLSCFYGQGLSNIKQYFPTESDRQFMIDFLKTRELRPTSAVPLRFASDPLDLSSVKMVGGHLSIFTFMQTQVRIDLADRYLFLEYHHVPGEDLIVLGYFLHQLLYVIKDNMPKGFVLGRSILTQADGTGMDIETINAFLVEKLSRFNKPVYYIDHFRNIIEFN